MNKEEYISTVEAKVVLKVRIEQSESGEELVSEVLDILQIQDFKEGVVIESK